jgi:predicted  nucleic acid-binding Zn-ribbon protein
MAPFKHKGIAVAMEIESLRARKERLKDELRDEEEKAKSLQEDIEILEEKIEIRDLEKNLEAERESVRQLESRKSELQDKWDQPSQDTKKEEEPKESSQLVVNVEQPCSSQPIQSDESNAQKRRRFF